MVSWAPPSPTILHPSELICLQLGILCRRTQHVKLMHLLWVPLYSAEHYELIE